MFRRLRRRLRHGLGGRTTTQIAQSPPATTSLDGEDRRLTTFRDILRPLKPGRLVDLGTGHGKFALIAQELGWNVTAVDARTERMPMTPGIDWQKADVRTFDVAGFDCISMLGVLYHLEYADVRALLGRCAGTMTIIDTHTARRIDRVEEGYEGRTFTEISDYSPARLATTKTASWGNPTSWWPTRPALIRLLQDSGYRTILVLEPPTGVDRTFYLCL
ncbi:MAG: class I SAM-dependent methyltransferase [Chloroflexota bacterium]